jgi:hypothetical protein
MLEKRYGWFFRMQNGESSTPVRQRKSEALPAT